MKEPVVLMKRNLYGHPRAGFLWEKFSTSVMLSEGFEKVPGWECLFIHQELQLMLSEYVDDFKLAGKNENIKKG